MSRANKTTEKTSRAKLTTGSPPTPGRNFPSVTDPKIASLASATQTSPKITWASVGEQMFPDSGLSQSTDQFFATRVRTRIAGGRWLAIAPIFVGGYYTLFKSPFGITNTPAYTCSFTLELANGTQTYAYQSSNAGGTLLAGTFGGNTDGIVLGGGMLVGDLIYASSASLPYFQWTDRTLLPWIRVAYSKTAAGDNIGGVQNTEYNYPSNSHYATCTSYANAKTLINTTGVNSYNAGNNFWGANDPQTMPSCIGFVGIGLDGQKSVIFFGTSIVDGDGASPSLQGGVDPTNNVPANYDLIGYPCFWAQHLSRSTPVLNFGIGASGMYNDWSNNATDISWSTGDSRSLSRAMQTQLATYFDVIVAHDAHNDGGATGSYTSVVQNFTNAMRKSCPGAKLIGCRVPNGYVDISGTLQPYTGGALDTRWSVQDSMLTAGYWDAMLTTRESGSNIFPDLGAQVSSTTTSNGSTTTLIDSTATWLTNQWTGSWIVVGGVKRSITSNTRTTLTFTAFGAAVNTATAYAIQGNCSSDGLHPTRIGQIRMAANFDTQIASIIAIPKFTRTT